MKTTDFTSLDSKPFIGKDSNDIKEDIPFYERREYWRSPLAILLIVGYIIFGILYALSWILKWVLFSWMRPFSNSKLFCQMGFHKYRDDKGANKEDDYSSHYICRICGKTKVRKKMVL